MNTSLRLILAICVLECGWLAIAQEIDVNELPRPELRGLTQKEVSRRIFSTEQAMIRGLASLRPVTETYIQSLGHRQKQGVDVTLDGKSENVIDDLYFLARVDFAEDGPTERLLAGGGSWKNRYIKANSGALEQVYPMGMLMMFFVDLDSFDGDRYALKYEGRETLADTATLVFSVASIKERDSGSFRGQIWVDSSSFAIVRVKGVFAGPYERFFKALKGPERYFHFDSWREKTRYGWLPSVTYFDESHSYHSDGNLEFHYRGYAFLWQQPEQSANAQRWRKTPSLSDVAEADSPSQNPLVARLETDGLLAVPGTEEGRLDRIVQQIAPAGAAGTHNIECRVLMTTPVEIFAVENTIIVSRGLLNLVSDDSVLKVILARQVAHIVLGHTAGTTQTSTKSLFDEAGKRNFAGLGIHWGPGEEAAADVEAIAMLKRSLDEKALANASSFLAQLRSGSHRFPNLVRARFGFGVIPEPSSQANKVAPGTPQEELRFANRYRISWNRVIVDGEQEPARSELTILKKPLEPQTSVTK